nr:MAG TPA: hypothetical protein [Caudoviricetes sp.]
MLIKWLSINRIYRIGTFTQVDFSEPKWCRLISTYEKDRLFSGLFSLGQYSVKTLELSRQQS